MITPEAWAKAAETLYGCFGIPLDRLAIMGRVLITSRAGVLASDKHLSAVIEDLCLNFDRQFIAYPDIYQRLRKAVAEDLFLGDWTKFDNATVRAVRASERKALESGQSE